ncbi:uncharacterized protein LOC126355433 [Schistocerca gregaria]|uniref:uncharacterized protein LOC126355433 n=1 Tax=Schistocerca gregaria TaxID=7010 RepID=UPI00211DF809|nr:uncharacterized protein LOC126355433 [Schistocerca gregaria]
MSERFVFQKIMDLLQLGLLLMLNGCSHGEGLADKEVVELLAVKDPKFEVPEEKDETDVAVRPQAPAGLDPRREELAETEKSLCATLQLLVVSLVPAILAMCL